MVGIEDWTAVKQYGDRPAAAATEALLSFLEAVTVDDAPRGSVQSLDAATALLVSAGRRAARLRSAIGMSPVPDLLGPSRPPRRTTPGDPRGPERGGEPELRQQPQAEPAGQPPSATPTVPIRPDGWPDWLGRRPMSSSDRDKIRQALTEGLPEGPLTDPGPFLCYLTIDGLHRTDPGSLIALRGRIHAAARPAHGYGAWPWMASTR